MSRASTALDNLRAFVIVIVLAFHSVLAYLDFLPASPHPFDVPPYEWRAFPIIDRGRWIGFDVFCAFQDVYLMSLMFFLSGLFVWSSLRRKGSWIFLVDRCARLGVPFAFAVVFLMPIALYPTYRVTATDPSLAAYWDHWHQLGFWPNGPQWFLWQLVVLNVVAAIAHRLWSSFGERLERLARTAAAHPLRCFVALVVASAIAYVPLALVFTPFEWLQYGPLGFQLCRPLHYLVYFAAGIAVGACGLERGLLVPDGALSQRWAAWLGAAVALFALWMGCTAATRGEAPPVGLQILADLCFVLSCASGCFATLALFMRFALTRWRASDSLANSAYGMYLVHYVFVVWLQYSLLDADMHAIAKAAIVFAGTLLASWGATAAIFRVPLGARLIGADRTAVARAS